MTPAIAVVPIETPGLGDRSYLVHDGEVALVVDPQRDVDRVFAAAARAGVRISHVVETHIHNDYVTGGYALARAAGAAYLVNADDPVGFDRVGVRDGDVVQVGAMTVRVLHTPGYMHTHLAYVLWHGGHPVAALTCGPLLYGSTGRPDLLGPDHTHALARAQWRSARRLADELPDDTAVYPTDGSAASAGHPERCHDPHYRSGACGQPGAAARRACLRRGVAGRLGRAPRRLRPHGACQPRRTRARPVAARAR